MLFGVRKDSTKKTYSVPMVQSAIKPSGEWKKRNLRYVGTDRRVGQRIYIPLT
jgi:hypothetical protein